MLGPWLARCRTRSLTSRGVAWRAWRPWATEEGPPRRLLRLTGPARGPSMDLGGFLLELVLLR